MSTDPFFIVENDLQPYYYVEAVDANGDAIDLSGATIYCTMRSQSGSLKINRQTTGISITGAADGEFEYHWQSGDTNTPGSYTIEFEINPTAGGKFTLPAKPTERAVVRVMPSLDTV